MLTIAPGFLVATRRFVTARLHRNAPSWMVRVTRRHSSTEMVRMLLGMVTPALFTRMSMVPCWREACSTALSTASGSVMSKGRGNALPASPAELAAASAMAGLRSLHSTVAPARASVAAMARPILGPAPVTSATRPERSYMEAPYNDGYSDFDPSSRGARVLTRASKDGRPDDATCAVAARV